jgi:hypothetical protein
MLVGIYEVISSLEVWAPFIVFFVFFVFGFNFPTVLSFGGA